MHGLVAALGSAARHLTRDAIVHHLGDPAGDAIHHFVDDPGVSVALLVPRGTGAVPPVAKSPRGSLSLALSGYLLVDSARGLLLPVIKPRVAHVKHDHDEWHEWLPISPALRARVGGVLAKVGLAAADHLQSKLEDIEHGRERSAGELAQLTAFAHLLTARPVLRAARHGV